MGPEGETEVIEAIEIRLLLEAMNARHGYDLRDYAPHSLRRRMRAALARSGLPSLGALQHALLTDPAVFVRVLEDLTVRVTDMFRDPDFYLALRERVVPILRTYPLLRVWHAGCATGEEAYATAIVLSEAGLLQRARIYATDLSPAAIEQATRGTYPARSFSSFSANYAHAGGRGEFADYVITRDGELAITPELRRNILFLQHDLVGDQVFGEMHAVFCRNVLIYFGRDLRRRVLHKLVQSLCPGGFLCLGASERLGRDEQHELDLVEHAPDVRIYRHT